MRKVVIAVFTCVLALTAILVLLLATLDIGRYRGLIEAQASQAVGRDVKLAGAMGFDLALHPTLVAEQVSVANPSWASRPLLATFERVEATIGLLPLLARRVEIHRLALDGADIGLERAADGHPNWQLTAAAPTIEVSQAGTRKSQAEKSSNSGGARASELPTTGASSIPFVREVRIATAVSPIAMPRAVSTTNCGWPRGASPRAMPARRWRSTLPASSTASPMSLKGEVGALAALMAGTGPYPVDLHVKALGLDIEVSGAAALRGGDELDLRATASAADPAAVRTALGPYLTSVELLEGSGPLRAAGRLRGTFERAAIEDLAERPPCRAGRRRQGLGERPHRHGRHRPCRQRAGQIRRAAGSGPRAARRSDECLGTRDGRRIRSGPRSPEIRAGRQRSRRAVEADAGAGHGRRSPAS